MNRGPARGIFKGYNYVFVFGGIVFSEGRNTEARFVNKACFAADNGCGFGFGAVHIIKQFKNLFLRRHVRRKSLKTSAGTAAAE